MRRRAGLSALLALSVAGGLWVAWPRSNAPAPLPSDGGSCTAGETCDSAAARDAAPAQVPANVAAPAPPTVARPGPVAPSPQAPPPPRPGTTPLPGKTLRETADSLLAEGRIPEAIESFRAATNDDPSPRNHGDFGMLLERLTAFNEAEEHLRLAAQLDPTNADRWIALANLYYLKTEPGLAWIAEDRARKAEPGLQLGRGEDGLLVRRGDSAAGKP